MAGRQAFKGSTELLQHLRLIDGESLDRSRRCVRNMSALEGGIQDLHTGGVRNNDLADKTIGFFHQDDSRVIARADIQADLSTANTDRRDRRIKGHCVGIGLGDLATDKGEDTFNCGNGNGAFLGGRVVDHFIKDHVAVFGHGKCRFIGKGDTDRAATRCLDNIALIDRGTRCQFDRGAIRPGCGNQTGSGIDCSDRLRLGTRRGLRDFSQGGVV